MLMAFGPNDVQAPCMFFDNSDDADAFINSKIKPHAQCVSFQGRMIWRVNSHNLPKPLQKVLFSKYYGGCGEATAFELRPLPINTPFLEWNLD